MLNWHLDKHAQVKTRSAADLMTMPLSMEKLSVGSPAIVQARILTGSPSVELRESSSEQGMLRLVHMLRHSSICSCGSQHREGGRGGDKGGGDANECMW